MISTDIQRQHLAFFVAFLAIAIVCIAVMTTGSAHPVTVPVNPPEPSVADGPEPIDDPKEAASPIVRLTAEETVVGHSVEGRPIPCVRIGEGDYVILFLASIHGNEAAGTPLMQRLVSEIELSPQCAARQIVVVLPSVNPDGMNSDTRSNARGVDLNRNFPADNRENSRRYGMQALSEPEALAVYQTIERFMPDHIVTLHQPLQCIDYDGPARDLAATMSKVSPLAVKKLGSRPGSLGAFAGETLGIPTITLELPRNAASQTPELLWQFYGPALKAAVEFRVTREQ